MVTLVVTMMTVAVTTLAARLQPQEHEQTQQSTSTSKGHLMAQRQQHFTSPQPCSRPKGKLDKYTNRTSDLEQGVLISALSSCYV